MSIKFKCKHCGRRYQVADNLAGKGFKCKECGNATRVPADVFMETVDRMERDIGAEMEATSPTLDEDGQGARGGPQLSPRLIGLIAGGIVIVGGVAWGVIAMLD